MNLAVKKIELILPKKETAQSLEELQKTGFLEIIPAEENSEELIEQEKDYRLKLSEVNFALSFLENFKPKENFLKNLILGFFPLKRNIKEADLKKTIQSDEVKSIIQRCAEIEEKINRLGNKKNKLADETNILEKFKETSITANPEIAKIDYFAGSVTQKEKNGFLDELKEKKSFYLETGKDDVLSFNFVLFYNKKEDIFYKELLKKYQAREEVVFWREPARQSLKTAQKEKKEVEIEIEIQEKEARKLLLFIPELEALSDWFGWQTEKEEFLKQTEKTKKYFAIKAWIAEKKIPELRAVIEKTTDNFLLKGLPLLEEENPPVIIENRGIMGSFGVVTGVYGLPKKNELDPTPFLALFFIFYFALALSDSGYGILLVIFSLFAKKAFKGAGVDNFFNLFIFGGILTALAGIFMGTVFGTNLAESFRIIDPITNPIKMLIFVLMLGVFQIFVGLIIGAVWLIKRGEIRGAISGNGASIAFFIGLFLAFLLNDSIYALFGLAIMVFMSIFYSLEKNIFSKIIKGFGAVYGLVGYFSDVLSYSRILALGLATGIIAAVINMIALIIKEMIPVPGLNWLIAGIVVIFGHIGNLLINALGAFIHSARLQFVEFFSKFMEGGGRYFKPFTKKGRFIEIIN